MDREDTKPWYRQFWPWFIIALPASSVIAGLTTVWISLQTTDSLVVQAEDGVKNAADRRISAERLASEMNLAALLEIDTETGVVSAVIRSGDLNEVPATLDLEFSHPAFAHRDQLLTLNKAMPDASGNPVWVGHFSTISAERYYVVLKAGDMWRLSAEWQGESSLTLRPGGNDAR